MGKAVTWLLCTYLALKGVQYVFGGRPGFRDIEPTLREKLLRGEPVLFAIAFALSVPVALWSSWYFHRGYTRSLQASTDCYGQLRALNQLPGVARKFDAYSVYDAVGGAELMARIAGEGLELAPIVVSKTLADKTRLFSARYALLARQGDPRKIQDQAAAIEHCFDRKFLNL
jgi:hypothetical protein